MPIIKLTHVVSCSSEETDHEANNLLNTETKKKWKNRAVGEISASVIFQLDKSSNISGVDIGNENSSFVEVLVGRSSSQEEEYKILLAMSSFMTPMESRNLTDNNRVRMFTYNDLASDTRDEKWDRVKVVCTQPFNKHVQYGLSFITLHSPQEEQQDEKCTIGKFTLRPVSPRIPTPGSWFVKRKESVNSQSETSLTVAQAIRTSSKKDHETKNRNRKTLFYDSDDEKSNENIDKIIDQVKEETEKKKKRTAGNKPITKQENKYKCNPKPSTSKKDDKCSNGVTDNNSSTKNLTENSKRKVDATLIVPNKKQKLPKMPFSELLSGIVFTISGIVNPERANLRTFALSMGAKYRPDWDNSCTHLICAFANTPKFNQVQGKGKIVTKMWIKDCFDQRKRLPWRRYALDRNDQGKPESEDEVEELAYDSDEVDNDNKNMAKIDSKNSSDCDTDDEIEKISTIQENKDNVGLKQIDEDLRIDTDEDEFSKKSVNVENIPKLFNSDIFYIDEVFNEKERNVLQRLIQAFDGVIVTNLKNEVDFVITSQDSAKSIKEQYFDVKCVSCTWIYKCHDSLKRISCETFLLS